MAEDLMLLPASALAYAQTVLRKRGHAGHPGRGPTDETCGSCQHYASVPGGNRVWPKCELNRRNWTGGPGSDIRKKDPACEFWGKKESAKP
jgi:hypothetical protein